MGGPTDVARGAADVPQRANRNSSTDPSAVGGAEARHDARLAGDGAERVMEAGGYEGLAARAQQMLLTVEAS